MAKKPAKSSLSQQISRNTTKLPKQLQQELGIDLRKPSFRKRQANERSAKADDRPRKVQKVHKTALEKRLEKTTPTFNAHETQEAKEIAWLEAQLGSNSHDEWAQDGLEDLFADLDRVEAKLGVRGSEGLMYQKDDASDDQDEEMEMDDFYTTDEDSVSAEEWSGIVDPQSNMPSTNARALSQGKTVRFETDAAEDSAPIASTSKTAYVPPHLRKQLQPNTEEKAAISRLERILSGHLNKLSPSNLSSILTAIEAIFTEHPRAIVSQSLVKLIIERVAHSADILGEIQVLTLAALSASIFGTGLHIREGTISESLRRWDEYTNEPNSQSGKEKSNIVRFWSRMYNLDVIGCQFIYGLIRELIGSKAGILGEDQVEQLLICLKSSGVKLRSDDPSSLKQIVQSVENKKKGNDSLSSRTKFMVETLTNIKNNRFKQDASQIGPGSLFATEEGFKKHLSALGRTKAGGVPEPFSFTMEELRKSTTEGKWWVVGAAWSGDPLLGTKANDALDLRKNSKNDGQDAIWLRLAKKQGMNTDVRKAIFVALMGAEDYVDAWDRLQLLSLKEIQQREIVRVILHCCGNEKTFNPFYVLVVQRMLVQTGTNSNSIAITLQYSLWDFLRELGQKDVGGQERLKNGSTEDNDGELVAENKKINLARAFAWWIAKGSLTLNILKPVPFTMLVPQATEFISSLLLHVLMSIHCSSPLLTNRSSFNTANTEKVFGKVTPGSKLANGMAYFVEDHLINLPEAAADDLIGKSVHAALDTLSRGESNLQEDDMFI